MIWIVNSIFNLLGMMVVEIHITKLYIQHAQTEGKNVHLV